MREPHLIPESEMSSEELVRRATLALAPEAPPLPPAKRLRRQERMLSRMARYVPSERNRRIFEQVVICHKSHTDVAFTERLSRQRVAKIVQRMRDWIAYWGGDDAPYAPQQRYRLATHIASRELAEFQRQIQKALEKAERTIESNRFRFDKNGDRILHERGFQAYPCPASLYKMLLTAILARARLSGAGRDAELELGAGANSQSMVVKTEINVNQTASSCPPKEALRSDVLSGSASVTAQTGPAARTIEGISSKV